MNCPTCSAPLKPGARFCAECGATAPQAPAYTDKTMIASPLPPAGGRTAPMNPGGAQYGPPAPQPYAQPQYGQPAQPQQPQYGQPQYGPPAQYAPPVAPYAQGGQAYGYNVPAQAPVAANKGFISGLIMLLSSLAMAVGIFLPFLSDSSESISLMDGLVRLSEYGLADVPGEGWLFVSIPVLIVLSLLSSGLALWRRRNLWAVFSLLFGLVLFGFLGLASIGLSVEDSSGLIVGSGLWLILGAAFVLLVTSIVFLATKKAPR
jgi:hypothetical protein